MAEAQPAGDGTASRRLRDQLYAGETLEAAVSLDRGEIAVTSHRVLVLTPDGDGPVLRTVHRPNVTSIGVETAGDADRLVRGGRYALYGGVLLVGGAVFNPGATLGAVELPRTGGIGAVRAVIGPLLTLVGLVDDAMLLAGFLTLVVGLGFLGYYAYGRDRYVEVGVAGDDPLRVPVGGATPRRIGELDAAVETASNPPRD